MTGGRWQRRKDARAGELLAAALALTAERGHAGLRMDDIAVRAGVSKGTVYRYFRSRRELLAALVRAQIGMLADQGEAAAPPGCGAAEHLRGVICAWWLQMRQARDHGFVALLLAEGRQFPHLARFCHQQTIARYRATIAGIVERAVASGEFRPVDSGATAQLLVTPILSLLGQCGHGAGCDCQFSAAEFPHAFLDAMLRGLTTV